MSIKSPGIWSLPQQLRLGSTILWLSLLAGVIVLASRWTQIAFYGSSLVYYDQWGLHERLFSPYVRGESSLETLFAAHNGHRIFWTRIVALACFAYEGVYNNLTQILVNAIIPAMSACLLTGLGCRLLPRSLGFFVWPIVVTAAWALPYTWVNLVWGFQGQFHWQTFFAILALPGLILAKPGRPYWFLGLVAGLASLGTGGSAFLVAMPVLLLMLMRAMYQRKERINSAITAVAALAIVGLGFLLYQPEDNSRWQAETLGYFILSLLRCLAWPAPESAPWVAFIIFAPSILWISLLILNKTKSSHVEVLCAFSLWVGTQCVAIAFARGTQGIGPHDRYADFLLLGWLANLAGWLAFLAWQSRATLTPVRRWAVRAALILWFIVAVPLMLAKTTYGFERLDEWGFWNDVREERVFRFVQTQDPAELEQNHRLMLPLPHPDALERFLLSPNVLDQMPGPLVSRVSLESNEPGHFDTGEIPLWLPPITDRRIFSSYPHWEEKSQWQSKPLIDQGKHLEFYVAGEEVGKGMRLRLVGVNNGKRSEAKLSARADDGWRRVVLAPPDETFYVEALDNRSKRWIAFTEPSWIHPRTAQVDNFLAFIRQHVWTIILGLVFGASLILTIRRTIPRPTERQAVSASERGLDISAS
ncbi:MAG: hypothetical protein ACFCU3_01115 [Verrucomicrobiales bacterium]